jgi:GNAT superfamily N-acetyltransferase
VKTTIELLDAKRHNRTDFACGVPELNQYLQRYAGQDSKRNLTRVFVATQPERDPGRVLGFYTLSSASVERFAFPDQIFKQLPAYPVPCVLLGRLAVCRTAQGTGLGAYLLIDALRRVFMASQTTLGVHAVLVDAKSEQAAAFYRKYGFHASIQEPNRLFLMVQSIAKLFAEK